MTSQEDPVQGRPAQTPFGALIRTARGTRKVRPLAIKAGISEARWRQIENGYQPIGAGVYAPANPSGRTVLVMANAVGVDEREALTAAGFDPDGLDELLAFLTVAQESVAAAPHAASGVLLYLPAEVTEGMSPTQVEEVEAAARLRAYEKAREIRGSQ